MIIPYQKEKGQQRCPAEYLLGLLSRLAAAFTDVRTRSALELVAAARLLPRYALSTLSLGLVALAAGIAF